MAGEFIHPPTMSPLRLLIILVAATSASHAAPLDEARQLAGEGKHAQAIVKFEEAIAANATLAEAHAGRAASLLAIGKMPEAAGAIARAIALKPDEIGFLMIDGRVLIAKNDIEGARRRYDQSAKLAPKKAGTVYADFASALSGKNDPKLSGQIEAALKSAVAADPPHVDSFFHLGQIYVAAGKEEGRGFLNRYLEEQARLPEKQKDARKVQLAKQMIRAMDIVKATR